MWNRCGICTQYTVCKQIKFEMCIYHYECDEELDKDDTRVLMKLEEIFHEGSLHMTGPLTLNICLWLSFEPLNNRKKTAWRLVVWMPSYSTLNIGYKDNMIYQVLIFQETLTKCRLPQKSEKRKNFRKEKLFLFH